MADNVDYGPRIGADPELFVQNSEGQIVPICGKIGGTKENPYIVEHLIDAQYGQELDRRRNAIDRKGNYAVQEDNVMLEINTPAYADPSYFINAINKMMSFVEGTLLPVSKLQVKHQVTHSFKPEDLAPFPQAFTLGCLPDMDAYSTTGSFERPPFNAVMFGNNRFCGGHLHVQYNTKNVPEHVFVQFMDIMAELPFLRWDKQRMRRMFYGQPGIYREKPYGIEYRTASNFWLVPAFREKYLPQLLDNVLNLAKLANSNPETLRNAYEQIDWGDVQQAIKTENVKLADELIGYIRNKIGLFMSPPALR